MDWLLVPIVFCMLGLARAAILILPFKAYVPLMGKKVPLDSRSSKLTERQATHAKRIGRLIRAVARNTPWESLCLAQAIVAVVLLRVIRIPQTTYFGVAKSKDECNESPLLAHSWVMAQDIPLTGGKGHERYTVVNAFAYGI